MLDCDPRLLDLHPLKSDVLLAVVEESCPLRKFDEEEWSDDTGNDSDNTFDDEDLEP